MFLYTYTQGEQGEGYVIKDKRLFQSFKNAQNHLYTERDSLVKEHPEGLVEGKNDGNCEIFKLTDKCDIYEIRVEEIHFDDNY